MENRTYHGYDPTAAAVKTGTTVLERPDNPVLTCYSLIDGDFRCV